MAKYTPKRVLVVAAHPDDIEISAGGTLALWASEGAAITFLLCTNGRAGSNVPETDLDELVVVRRDEQRRAAAILGVSDVRFLDRQDGTLTPDLELRKEITKTIRELKAEVIMTFDPQMYFSDDRGYVNHPDHRAVGLGTIEACFPSAGCRPAFPELLADGYEPYDPSHLYMFGTNAANFWVDITEHIETKMAAIRVHASQLDEATVRSFTQMAQKNASAMNCDYAEKFRKVDLV